MTPREEKVTHYACGDKVRLLADIWADGCDGQYPPGYLGRRGEILVVRRGTDNVMKLSIGISHEHRTDAYFNVTLDEIERIT